MTDKSKVVPSVDAKQLQSISRTNHYKKVMKSTLERQRSDRMNRCLDELKELMAEPLAAAGEDVSMLDRVEFLELTVRHLTRLRRTHRRTDADRYRTGFNHCAAEVCRCLAATPGIDITLGTLIMTHLGRRLNDLDTSIRRPQPSPAAPPYRTPLTVKVRSKSGTAAAPAAPVYSPVTPPSASGLQASSSGSRPSASAGSRPSTSAGSRPSTSAGSWPSTSAGSWPSTSAGKRKLTSMSMMSGGMVNTFYVPKNLSDVAKEEDVWRPW